MEEVEYENKKQEIIERLSNFKNEFIELLNKHNIEIYTETGADVDRTFFRLKNSTPLVGKELEVLNKTYNRLFSKMPTNL